jgi:hypothetical protein
MFDIYLNVLLNFEYIGYWINKMIKFHTRLFSFSTDFYQPCKFKLNIDGLDK